MLLLCKIKIVDVVFICTFIVVYLFCQYSIYFVLSSMLIENGMVYLLCMFCIDLVVSQVFIVGLVYLICRSYIDFVLS